MRRTFVVLAVAVVFAAPIADADDPTAANPAKQRVDSMNKLREIALAYHNYIAAHEMLPITAGVGPDGKPLLSWRVHLLFCLDNGKYGELHKQFKFDESWDSEHNKQLIEKMPDTYKAPGSKAAELFKTVYLAPVGKSIAIRGGGIFKQAEFGKQFADNILLVEAADERAVVWTKPDDYEFDETLPLYGLVDLRKDGFLAVFGDGSPRFINDKTKDEALKAMFLEKPEEK